MFETPSNLIVCGYQEVDDDDDWNDEDEDEEIVIKYKAVIVALSIETMKPSFTMEIPLRVDRDCSGDFSLLTMPNDTVDGGRGIDSTIYVLIGSNLETVRLFMFQEVGGVMEPIRRLNESDMDIDIAGVRGAVLIDWDVVGNGVFGIAMNEKVYLVNRLPTLLVLTAKMELVQY